MIYLSTLLGYFITLFLCIILALSVENLFLLWVLLELNILCFIPIFISRKSSNSTSNSLKYFVSQSRASLLFIIIIIFPTDNIIFLIILIIFKIGVPPLQRWLTSLLPTLNHPEIFILFTVQKLIPLIIVSHLNCINIIYLFVAISLLFTISCLVDTISLFKLLFISSVVNIIWTLRNLWNRWLVFFRGYTTILGGLIINLVLFNINKARDLITGPSITKIIIPIQFFNLGGVPPLIGFNLKLILLNKLIYFNPRLALALLLATLIVLYIYTIIFYQANCMKPSSANIKTELESRQQTSLSLISLLSTSFLYPLII